MTNYQKPLMRANNNIGFEGIFANCLSGGTGEDPTPEIKKCPGGFTSYNYGCNKHTCKKNECGYYKEIPPIDAIIPGDIGAANCTFQW